MPIMSLPKPISTDGNLRLSYMSAQGLLRILGIKRFAGPKAIKVSRVKAEVLSQIQEIDKQRETIIDAHAVHEPSTEDGKPGALKADPKTGHVSFLTPADEKACQTEIGELLDGAPIILDLSSEKMKDSVAALYNILTGEDCPEIQTGDDFFHALIVSEMELARVKA